MPLQMNREVFITCAVTGSGSTQDRSPNVPRSPKEIADSAIAAGKAGAAIVHCHVRDPDTGVPSRDLRYYREVTDRIRDSETDVVLKITDEDLHSTDEIFYIEKSKNSLNLKQLIFEIIILNLPNKRQHPFDEEGNNIPVKKYTPRTTIAIPI